MNDGWMGKRNNFLSLSLSLTLCYMLRCLCLYFNEMCCQTKVDFLLQFMLYVAYSCCDNIKHSIGTCTEFFFFCCVVCIIQNTIKYSRLGLQHFSITSHVFILSYEEFMYCYYFYYLPAKYSIHYVHLMFYILFHANLRK